MSDQMSDPSVAVLDAPDQSPEQFEVAAWLPPLIKVLNYRLASNDQGIELLHRHMAALEAEFHKMLEQQAVKGKKKAKRRHKQIPSAAELDRYREKRLNTTIWQGTARELAGTLRACGYQALADRIRNVVDAFWLPDGSECRTIDLSNNLREDGRDYLTRESASLRALLLLFEDIRNKPAERLSPNTRALLVRQEPVSEEAQARVTAAQIEYDTARLDLRLQAPGGTSVAARSVAHSPGFRSINWFGRTYSFTANQAKVVEMLYENWLAGAPDVDDETLLSAVDHAAPPKRLAPLFRKNKAWGALIVEGGTKGTHRLSDPEPS
jgi:hypothetical protein